MESSAMPLGEGAIMLSAKMLIDHNPVILDNKSFNHHDGGVNLIKGSNSAHQEKIPADRVVEGTAGLHMPCRVDAK